MPLPRAAIPRPLLSAWHWQAALAPTRPRLNWRRWQQFTRRTYASHEGHGSAKSGSDLPWLLASITVTAPAVFYLYNSGPQGRGHGPVVKEHSEEEEGSGEDGSGSSESVENPSNKAQEAPQDESADGPPESVGVEGESKGDPGAPEQAKHEDNPRQGDLRETSPASTDDHEPSQRDEAHST